MKLFIFITFILSLTMLAAADEKLLLNTDPIKNEMETVIAEFFNTVNQKLSTCPQARDLLMDMAEHLKSCTMNLQNWRTIFTGESSGILQNIQTYATELTNIPAYCELLISGNGSTSWASSTACFVQKFVELNRNFGLLINQANTAGIRTRASAENALGTECAVEVFKYYTDYLNEAFKNC